MLEARRCFRVTVAPANVGMAAKGSELSLSPGAAQKVKKRIRPPRTKIFRGGPFFFRVID